MTVSVYRHKYEDYGGYGEGGHNERRCLMCGGKLQYPFLGWDSGDDGVFLCCKCCSDNERGFLADYHTCVAIYKFSHVCADIVHAGLEGLAAMKKKHREDVNAAWKKSRQDDYEKWKARYHDEQLRIVKIK